MTQLLFICFVFVLVTISAVISSGMEDIQCEKRNAIKTDCATNCELDRCPVTEHYSRVCDTQGCKPGCKCGFNEKFSENGTCVPTQQCPPFRCDDRKNEVYMSCPSYCSDSCSQRNCATFGFLMVVECFPACRCQQGFYRKKGICVQSELC